MRIFADRLIHWQRAHGRHHLPWQNKDAYNIWLSEIMLQQTQVRTVIPYYLRFIARFPDILSLAAASVDEVLTLWSGLGYYSRARNLHHAARQIRDEYNGCFPRERKALEQLKGVGRSTAAAICVFAFGGKEAICDGNVKRVLARHHGVYEDITSVRNQTALWALAESLLPQGDCALKRYTQGLMDLGSLICTRTKPDCLSCPVADDCHAFLHGKQRALPKRKAKKVRPVNDGWFLLCQTPDCATLLEKRSEKGIWGGLWTLPWFDDLKTLETWSAMRSITLKRGATDLYGVPVPRMVHRFTHFTLRIFVIHGQTSDKKSGQFFLPEGLSALALPTPISRLLNL